MHNFEIRNGDKKVRSTQYSLRFGQSQSFGQTNFLFPSLGIMACSTVTRFVVVFVTLFIISPANASIFSSIKNFISGMNEVKSSDCIEVVVTRARAGGNCDSISAKSLAHAAREALECFRGVEAPGNDRDAFTSSTSLKVIAVTLQKYCHFQSNTAFSEDTTAAADDLNSLGRSTRKFREKLGVSLKLLRLRAEQNAATQQNVATALDSVSKSETGNAGTVAKLLNWSKEDIQKLIESRNESNGISTMTASKVEESRRLLSQTQRLLARFSDACNPSLGADLPHIFVHAATFLASLHLTESIRIISLSGSMCFTQAALLVFDIIRTASIALGQCYTMTVDVAILRATGLACFLFHCATHCLPARISFA